MSTDREPYVQGRFYPGDHETMMAEVRGFFAAAGSAGSKEHDSEGRPQTILAMVPHAGWMFSGSVCAKTLARANLAPNIVLLGPKHSPLGKRLAVWSKGNWELPGLSVPVHEKLAAAVLASDLRLEADQDSHVEEHSLEVIIPFLAELNPEVRIVPVAIWNNDPRVLAKLGENLGRAVADFGEPVSIVVSSDMSHMLPDDLARRQDKLALEAVLGLDPSELYRIVAENDISMCGVMPMTVGLAAARVLGARRSELVAYATSGDVTGDRNQVVGYAGVLVD